MTATLSPNAICEVFDRFITTEYTTVDRHGQPITWPVTPYHHREEGCVDVTTGLGYPKKAYDARANPKVVAALLGPDGQRASKSRADGARAGHRRRGRPRPRRQPRALLGGVDREAARDRRACTRRSSCAGCSPGTTRASTSTCGPSASTSGPAATRPPSPSCSTPTWRRCARATTRSRRRRRSPPEGGAVVWDGRHGRARRALPQRRAVARLPGRLPVLGPASRSTSTAVRGWCASGPGAVGVPVHPGLACLVAHEHAPDFAWQRNFQVRGRPRRARRRVGARAAQAGRRFRAAARLDAVPLPAQLLEDEALPQDREARAREAR